MERNGIPTAASHTYTDRAKALAYLETVSAPLVVKADGLAAGKGVTVATELSQAITAVAECFDGRFGEAGSSVVIEEFLTGPEVSLLAFVDGTTVRPMAPAQDHKRVGEGDTGPNTGGMGVYSPVPGIAAADYARMVAILDKTARALREEGIDFRGVLYGGFILTDEGPKVLEYNTRFGDPETQVLLPRLETDLAEVLMATATGKLEELGELAWSDDVAVSVVLASGGYPGDYETGVAISGIEDAETTPGVIVYHAGTKLAEDGTVLTAGGRVLNVTAFGEDYASAIKKAYDAVGRIKFNGCYFRRDIAYRALSARDLGE
jgi:phosphoribosylamine---glycine ligase